MIRARLLVDHTWVAKYEENQSSMHMSHKQCFCVQFTHLFYLFVAQLIILVMAYCISCFMHKLTDIILIFKSQGVVLYKSTQL